MPFPKLSDFLSDPKYKQDKEFIDGCIDARLKELNEQAKKNRKNKREPDNIFDAWFGGNSDESNQED